MSKYIKLEDAIDCECPLNEIWEDCIDCPLYNSETEPCKMGKWLKSLPTIEVEFCEECKYAPYCEQRLAKEMFGNEVVEWREVDFCQHGERIEE